MSPPTCPCPDYIESERSDDDRSCDLTRKCTLESFYIGVNEYLNSSSRVQRSEEAAIDQAELER